MGTGAAGTPGPRPLGVHFPPGTESRFERNGEPPVARLVLDLGPELPDSTPRELLRTGRRRTVSIEAVPNRDQRFAAIQQ